MSSMICTRWYAGSSGTYSGTVLRANRRYPSGRNTTPPTYIVGNLHTKKGAIVLRSAGIGGDLISRNAVIKFVARGWSLDAWGMFFSAADRRVGGS